MPADPQRSSSGPCGPNRHGLAGIWTSESFDPYANSDEAVGRSPSGRMHEPLRRRPIDLAGRRRRLGPCRDRRRMLDSGQQPRPQTASRAAQPTAAPAASAPFVASSASAIRRPRRVLLERRVRLDVVIAGARHLDARRSYRARPARHLRAWRRLRRAATSRWRMRTWRRCWPPATPPPASTTACQARRAFRRPSRTSRLRSGSSERTPRDTGSIPTNSQRGASPRAAISWR